MKRNESRDDYLEAILVLKNEKGEVKSIDIANHLKFSKPSVSIAMKKLKDDGYIHIDNDGFITLTDLGLDIAKRTLEKHEFFTQLFVELGIDPVLAEEEACSLEHSLSEDTFIKLKEYISKKG